MPYKVLISTQTLKLPNKRVSVSHAYDGEQHQFQVIISKFDINDYRNDITSHTLIGFASIDVKRGITTVRINLMRDSGQALIQGLLHQLDPKAIKEVIDKFDEDAGIKEFSEMLTKEE